MKKEKKAIVLGGIILALSTVSAVGATEENPSYELEGITVEGKAEIFPGGLVNTKAKLGILGDYSVMDIPYSEMSMTSKVLDTFYDPSQPLASVLQNNPSIRSSTTSPMYTDFSMRGINMNGNHMMLNGIPSLFYQFTTPPSHVIERIDITSGPNAGMNGVSMSNNGTNSGATPAPGTINIVTKRAEDKPITRYIQSFSGRSNLSEVIDVGRRFGENNEWGLRINAEYMDGGLALPGASKEERNIFFNLDHKGKKSTTNLFAGHFDLRVDGAQRWFKFGGSGNILPNSPNSKLNYDFKETTKWVHGYIMTLNHEQNMNNDWSWFVNAGQSRRSGNKYNSSSALKFDDNGNFVNDNVANAQNEEGRNVYTQIGVKGAFETGEVKHHVSLAVDRSWARYWNASNNSDKGLIGGNIYDGVVHLPGFYPLPDMLYVKPQWEETNVGITLADFLEYGKWEVLLAASRKHERFINYAKNTRFINDDILPTYGLIYKPSENVSLYIGHTESLSRGAFVSDSKYINQGETMPPVSSKQNEIGIKWNNERVITTISYFDIDEANNIDVDLGDGKLLYAPDGKNQYKGLELTVNGKIKEKWTVIGGFLYLDAKRKHTKGGISDGKFVNGVSKWSTVLGVEYTPNQDWGIVARVVWNDKAYIDNSKSSSKKTEIPSWVSVDVGVHYKTRFYDVPVTLTAMCYNVFDNDYWIARGSSTTFGLSMPRMYMVSAGFEF